MGGRFILGDPSLMDFSGHCFEYLNALQGDLHSRGVSTAWLGNRAMRPNLVVTTGALPTFTYWCDARPVPTGVDASTPAGRSHVRRSHEQQIKQDLDQAAEALRLTANDVLFINTLRHWPLRGLVEWIESRGAAHAPSVVLVLHFTAYPSAEYDDGTANMYIEGFRRLEQSPLRERFLLLADSEDLIEEYKEMTAIEVHLVPIPHTPRSNATTRQFKYDDRIVIAYVGEARENKGVHLLPHLVEGFSRHGWNSRAHFHVQSFVHNPSDTVFRRTMGRLDQSNVTLFPDEMDEETYYDYLASADVVLLPYLLDNYYKQTSGIFAEAMSLGKPTVVSRGTWMARQIKKYGGGRLFYPGDPQSLLESVAEIVADYPAARQQAEVASVSWNRFHSAQNFVDLVLSHLKGAMP